MEQKELSFTNAMYVTWIFIAALAVMLIMLNGRITETQEMLTFVNDESLSRIQFDVYTVNENLIMMNDNFDILQNNIFVRINSTCGGD